MRDADRFVVYFFIASLLSPSFARKTAAAAAGIYRIKAGPELVAKLRNRRFEDRKKKAALRYCRAPGAEIPQTSSKVHLIVMRTSGNLL